MKKIFLEIEIIRPSKYVDTRSEVSATYDPNIGIGWLINNPTLSKRDK